MEYGWQMPSWRSRLWSRFTGFSFQHSIIELNNGNIVTLDNGNLSTFINNTPYPTTRGLEIAVNELNESCEASIEFGHLIYLKNYLALHLAIFKN